MQIIVKDITGFPPYHKYKNAIVLQFEIECNCGKKCKKTFILEDKKEQKQPELFSIKPILDVLKPIRFFRKNAPANTQKTGKNEKS